MTTIAEFDALVAENGSPVVVNNSANATPCPCQTPEGYRDPIWHLQHSNQPMCNEAGFLPGTGDLQITIKGFVQPAQTTRATRMRSEYLLADFGEVEAGDHIGIFPIQWQGTQIEFHNWGASVEDWVEYDGRRYTVVAANMMPDPDGGGRHHWEVGLRLVSSEPL